MSRYYSLHKTGFSDYSIDKNGNIYSRKKYYHGLKMSQRNRNGYLAVTLRNNGKAKTFNVHRLMAMTFLECNGDFKEYQVNHKDGNKLNNTLDNLEWCNQTENARHRERLGLQKRRVGQGAYNAKLADKEVRVIKKLYNDHKWKQTKIAKLFECSQCHVSQLINGVKRAKAIEAIKEKR